MGSDALERQAIRELVENWVLWRDAGDWERFRTVWHAGGRMMATWFQGTADRFIAVSREGFEKGVSILHFLGGSSIDIAGSRAISQTKMTISQRARVQDSWTSFAPVATMTSWKSVTDVGVWYFASPSTKRTAWTLSIRLPGSRSMPHC